MPVMDGLTATREILLIFKEFMSLPENAGKTVGQTPIVALTANDTENDRKSCNEAGMSHFLTKPFNMDAFEQILAMVFGKDIIQKEDSDY